MDLFRSSFRVTHPLLPLFLNTPSPVSSLDFPITAHTHTRTHLSSLWCFECDWQVFFGSGGLLVWIPRLWSSVVLPDLVLIRFLVWVEGISTSLVIHGETGKSLSLSPSFSYQGIYSLWKDTESCCWITPVPDIKSHIGSHPSTLTNARVCKPSSMT